MAAMNRHDTDSTIGQEQVIPKPCSPELIEDKRGDILVGYICGCSQYVDMLDFPGIAEETLRQISVWWEGQTPWVCRHIQRLVFCCQVAIFIWSLPHPTRGRSKVFPRKTHFSCVERNDALARGFYYLAFLADDSNCCVLDLSFRVGLSSKMPIYRHRANVVAWKVDKRLIV